MSRGVEEEWSKLKKKKMSEWFNEETKMVVESKKECFDVEEEKKREWFGRNTRNIQRISFGYIRRGEIGVNNRFLISRFAERRGEK